MCPFVRFSCHTWRVPTVHYTANFNSSYLSNKALLCPYKHFRRYLDPWLSDTHIWNTESTDRSSVSARYNIFTVKWHLIDPVCIQTDHFVSVQGRVGQLEPGIIAFPAVWDVEWSNREQRTGPRRCMKETSISREGAQFFSSFFLFWNFLNVPYSSYFISSPFYYSHSR